MNLHTYFGLCADHDWHYQFSSSHERYKKGIKESVILMEKYKESETYNGYRDIYDAWHDYCQGKRNKPDFKEFS